MTPEEELQKFRDEQPFRLERARKVALWFGILATTALIMFVYAFFQHTAANRNAIEAEYQMMKANDALGSMEQRATKAEEFEKRQLEILKTLREECQQKTKVSK